MDFKDRLHYEWNKPNNIIMRLIMINVAVYLLFATLIIVAMFTNTKAIQDWTIKILYLPPNIIDFLYRPWTLITYGFTHSLGGIFHILFNMLILYWFGQIVVSEIGSNRLLGLYSWGVVAGGIAFLMLYNLVPYFIAQQHATTGLIGASAGVYAIVVAAGTLLPDVKMRLFLIGDVKLKWIALGYVILSYISLAGGNAGGNVAHLGGALVGYLFILQYKKGNDWSKPIVAVTSFFTRLFTRKPKMKTYRSSQRRDNSSSKTGQAGAKKTANEQEIIDKILDKISESGYESLTKEEKQILFKASKQ